MCAPTGAGKTNIAMMAVLREVRHSTCNCLLLISLPGHWLSS